MKKHKKKIIIGGCIVLVLFLAYSIIRAEISFRGIVYQTNCENTSYDQALRWLSGEEVCDSFDFPRFAKTYVIEDCPLVSSLDRHTIPAQIITTDGNKDKDFVVIAHGLWNNLYYSYGRGELYLKLGFNILVYDQRSSGNNHAEGNTYGYLEKYDMSDCVDYVKTLQSEGRKLGVRGESFGGITALSYTGMDGVSDKIDFAIADSPVGSQKDMYYYFRELSGTPKFILDYRYFWINVMSKIHMGFYLSDADAYEAVKRSTVPTMIIFSEADELVPFWMGEKLYDSIPHDKKMYYWGKTSKHVMMNNDNPEEYRQKVTEFLDNFVY